MIQNKLFTIIRTVKFNRLIPNFKNSSEISDWNDKENVQFSGFFQSQVGNYGDRIIPNLAIDLLNLYLDEPLSVSLTQLKSSGKIFHFCQSRQTKALIIGPGGIISGKPKKTKKDQKWFINFTKEDAKEIHANNTAIIFWGSGVNIWSNKRQINDLEKDEIRKIFKYVTLAFIRGNADIDFLKSFLNPDDHYKLIFQPCPSFFIQEIRNIKKVINTNKVAINISSDQLFEYYQCNEAQWKKNKTAYFEEFTTKTNILFNYIADKGFEPVLFCNTVEDAELAKTYYTNYKIIETHKISPEYTQLEKLLTPYRFAIGMRLHAWLPFISLGIPSLFITPFHNRVSMAADLDLPELGILIRNDHNYNLEESFNYLVENEELLIKRINERKLKLSKTTEDNIKKIKEYIN